MYCDGREGVLRGRVRRRKWGCGDRQKYLWYLLVPMALHMYLHMLY